MQVELVKEFYVETAHRNPHGAGRRAQLHGHSLKVEVVVQGEVDPAMGWLIDYADIKRAFEPLAGQLDHHDAGEVEGLDDTSLDGIAAWIRARLAPALPGLKDVRVSIAGDCAFAPRELPADPGRNLPPRWRFSFEAAQSLPHLADGHPCRRLHGHTYVVEVGAGDLERLREPLRGLYERLDHRYLNEIPALAAATSERLGAWIWEWLSRHVDDLAVVVVQETASARCIYHGR